MLLTTLFSRPALLPEKVGVYGFHYSTLHFSQASTPFFRPHPALIYLGLIQNPRC